MLEKIDKIAPYAVVALLGYLCHSVMSPGMPSKAKAKDGPLITEEMLRPKLLVPEAHASPVNRDPFDVRWASYREEAYFTPGSQMPMPQDFTDSATSAPAYALDGEEGPPPLPTGLKGLLLGDTAQFVVVGDRICQPGDAIPGPHPSRSWIVERVEVDGVVLRFGNVYRKVQLSSTERLSAMATSAPSQEATSAPSEETSVPAEEATSAPAEDELGSPQETQPASQATSGPSEATSAPLEDNGL